MTYATIYPSIIQLFAGDGGLFQCPPKGREFLLAVFKAVRERSFLLMKMVRMGLIVALPLLLRVRREANTSSGNSVGVAIPQPRVAGEARYPGYIYNKV